MPLPAAAPAAAAAASSFAGPIMSGIGSVLGFLGQRKANKQNIKLAREQMAFQERMSNSAYQRAMADMRKAGLNPILAAKQPASSPGGATTRVDSALGAGVNAFNTTSSAKAQVANLRANTELTSAKATLEDIKVEAFNNPDDSPTQRRAKIDLHTFGLPTWAINQAIGMTTEGKSMDQITGYLAPIAAAAGVLSIGAAMIGIGRLLPAAAGVAGKGAVKAGRAAGTHFSKLVRKMQHPRVMRLEEKVN